MQQINQKGELNKILKDSKLKITKPRLAVLDVLSEIKRPATTQDIHKKLRRSGIDLVTLYRTLTSFEEKGILRRVDLRKDAVYYELNTNHHHHIVCTQCNSVEDFKNSEIEKSLKKIIGQSSKFKTLKEHSFELFGICKACA